MLKAIKNQNGNEVFAKERRGKNFVYLAKSEDGKVGTVTKNWILKHKNEIVNLGVSGDSIYPVSADKLVKCSICGEKHKKSTMTPVCSPVTENYDTNLIPNGEFVCSKCAKSDNVLLCEQRALTEVYDVSIKDLYKTYKRAIEIAEEEWESDCLADESENDFKPLEVLLCVSDGEVWDYYDLPWRSTIGWSEKMYFAKRIDLLDDKYTVYSLTDTYNPEEDEDLSEEERAEAEKEYETWKEELRSSCSLGFKSFEEVIDALIYRDIFNH